MSSTSERYESAAKKFDEAYNKYAGEAGWNLATEQAKQQAEEQSGRAGAKAGVEANIAARTAGLSKGRAAMLGSSAAGKAVADSYGNIYNSSQANALNNNQAAINAQGTKLSAAQQEGQNAYNRAWGNTGGAGSFISGLLTSDERLKEARDVSSGANTEDYECFKCSIGTKRTSLADIATELYNFGNDIRILHLYAAGKNFMEYHKKLNELYDEVFEAYDEIAELAISKGEKVPNPSSYSAFNSYKPLDPADYSSEQISQEVLSRGNKVLDALKNHRDYEGFVVSKLDDITGKLDKLINYIFKRSAISLSTSTVSDERLKHFREVSSKIGNKEPARDDYKLLMVNYTKKENK